MKVAFLDRDGVINKDTGYTYKIEDFEFLPNCIQALKILNNKGYNLIIVTNQSGIGRGYYSEDDYQILTQWYRQNLSEQDVNITDIFHCPCTPEENCSCRKPNNGMFMQAAEKYDIDFQQSLIVGDKLSDIEAAQKSGIKKGCLIQEDNSNSNIPQGFYHAHSLYEYAEKIL